MYTLFTSGRTRRGGGVLPTPRIANRAGLRRTPRQPPHLRELETPLERRLLTMVVYLAQPQCLLQRRAHCRARLSARWQMTRKGALSFGYGMHSSMESVHHYFATVEQPDGSIARPNLGWRFLLKAHHFVLGYDYRITPKLLY